MTKYKVRSTGKTVDLTKDNFKAKGGEGSIHIIGDAVYKVCEPGKMIPEDKFSELAVLDHPRIVRPMDILTNTKNQPVGYTMRLVPNNAKPLVQILTKTYREREGVTPNHMMGLTQQIADVLRYIHKHDGYLQVDGNECNYMVTENFEDIYFIDVNSFQTPHFPADAIMLSIRDWHVAQDNQGRYIWTKMSDWYSFAIISFYMFTAIHPFRGHHPDFTNVKTFMIDNMKGSKSVLDPQTQFPLGPVYHPFEDVIPGGKDGAYMQWYRALFIDNKRMAAPKDFQAVLTFVAKVREIVGSNTFDIRELKNLFDQVIGYYERSSKDVVVTKNHIFVNGNKGVRPAERFRVGFTPKNNIPFACWLNDEKVEMQNLDNGSMIPTTISGSDIMSCEGRVYVQSMTNIFEISFIEQYQTLIATTTSVATIMPNATTFYQGVAVQDMFGTLMFSVFPEAGHHRQIRIDELGDYRIIEAKYERNVLMVLAVKRETGQYDRFVIRFSKDWASYDTRIIENVTPTGINFTVLLKGICVCLTEEEKIEIFSNQKDSASVKSIDDPVIEADMRLCHAGDQVRFAKGEKIYSFAVKP